MAIICAGKTNGLGVAEPSLTGKDPFKQKSGPLSGGFRSWEIKSGFFKVVGNITVFSF